MAQVVETTIANNVTGMEEISKLINDVGALQKEMKALQQTAANTTAPFDKAAKSVNKMTNDLGAQSKAFRQDQQAMRMAGMQVGDFATQISTGANPVQAFNQQLGQLGYALSTSTKPRLAAVGNFLAGPWSIAVLGATMILGPMIEEVLGLGEASGNTKKSLSDLVEEKRAAFRQTEVTKQAEEAYKKTIEGVREAILANKKALGELNEAKQTSAEKALKEARANLANIKTLEAESTARLLNVKAMAQAQMQRAISAGAGSEIAAMGLAAAYRRVSEAEMDALKVSMDFVDAMNQVNSAERAVSAERIRYSASTDAATRATQELSESMDLVRLMIADGTLSGSEGRQQIAALAEAQEKLKDAAKESAKGTRGSAAAQREANEALRKALKLEKQMIEANVARASSLAKLTETMKKWEEQTEPKGQKPKTYQEVLATLENIETLEIKTPKGLQDIIDKNAEIKKSYESIGNAVANGFKGMITGAQSFGSAMKSIIQSVIDELFRLYVVQQIVGFVTSALSGAFGGGAQSTGSTGRIGGFRALGGSVSANTPYVVGEKGPELFMPGKSGTIIPNQNMPNNGGGGMVINVDARGSSDPEAVRQQVQQGILEAAPSIVAAAQNRTINTLRRPRLAGAL